jgi:hypothetical protein
MDHRQLFAELLSAAGKLDVPVRIEPFETPATHPGGFCILRGEPLILLNQTAPLPERITALAQALARLEHETIYIAPKARDLIEAARQETLSPPLIAGRATRTA